MLRPQALLMPKIPFGNIVWTGIFNAIIGLAVLAILLWVRYHSH